MSLLTTASNVQPTIWGCELPKSKLTTSLVSFHRSFTGPLPAGCSKAFGSLLLRVVQATVALFAYIALASLCVISNISKDRIQQLNFKPLKTVNEMCNDAKMIVIGLSMYGETHYPLIAGFSFKSSSTAKTIINNKVINNSKEYYDYVNTFKNEIQNYAKHNLLKKDCVVEFAFVSLLPNEVYGLAKIDSNNLRNGGISSVTHTNISAKSISNEPIFPANWEEVLQKAHPKPTKPPMPTLPSSNQPAATNSTAIAPATIPNQQTSYQIIENTLQSIEDKNIPFLKDFSKIDSTITNKIKGFIPPLPTTQPTLPASNIVANPVVNPPIQSSVQANTPPSVPTTTVVPKEKEQPKTSNNQAKEGPRIIEKGGWKHNLFTSITDNVKLLNSKFDDRLKRVYIIYASLNVQPKAKVAFSITKCEKSSKALENFEILLTEKLFFLTTKIENYKLEQLVITKFDDHWKVDCQGPFTNESPYDPAKDKMVPKTLTSSKNVLDLVEQFFPCFKDKKYAEELLKQIS